MLVNIWLKVSQQCVQVVKNFNGKLSCIRNSMASRTNKVTVLLCSALVRLHLESCVRLWAPHHKQVVELIKSAGKSSKAGEGTGKQEL